MGSHISDIRVFVVSDLTYDQSKGKNKKKDHDHDVISVVCVCVCVGLAIFFQR